jgi:DNA-binding PadR family transcriptional regulator
LFKHGDFWEGHYNVLMLQRPRKEFVPKRAQLKLLDLVLGLNEAGQMGSSEALVELAHGANSPAVLAFACLDSYGSLTSFSSKRVKGLLRVLKQHGYLTQRYDAHEEEYYFVTTPLGQQAALAYRTKPHAKAVVARKRSKASILPLKP